MPRKGKGAKTQPPRAANDQAYGQAGAQLEAQAKLPLPDKSGPPPAGGPPGAGGLPPGLVQGGRGGGPPILPNGQPSPELLEMAANLPPGGPGLGAPSQMPDQPITTGLPLGAGAGPEALMGNQPNRRRSNTIKTLEAMAAVSDDPSIQAMLDNARARGI